MINENEENKSYRSIDKSELVSLKNKSEREIDIKSENEPKKLRKNNNLLNNNSNNNDLSKHSINKEEKKEEEKKSKEEKKSEEENEEINSIKNSIPYNKKNVYNP